MRPSVLIVPGAWQLPVAFDTLKADLSATFPEVSVVPLPTVGGTSTPLPGLSDDVAAVRSELDRLVSKGSDVVVYSHSYGGVVASNAVEGYDAKSRTAAGKTGGVISVVYASAFLLPKGKSLIDMLGGEPLPWMIIEVSFLEPRFLFLLFLVFLLLLLPFLLLIPTQLICPSWY